MRTLVVNHHLSLTLSRVLIKKRDGRFDLGDLASDRGKKRDRGEDEREGEGELIGEFLGRKIAPLVVGKRRAGEADLVIETLFRVTLGSDATIIES